MIVTISNVKGGVGKTTSAISLAYLAVMAGYSTEILDADPQGTASAWALKAKEGIAGFTFDVKPANMATLQHAATEKYGFVFIDCPPAGNIIDRAVRVADFVIIPTSTSFTDLKQAELCVETMKELNQQYAVLLTKVDPHTIAYKNCKKYLDDQKISYFDTFIPNKEIVNRSFGGTPRNLDEYQLIFDELKGIENGSN